MTISLSLADRNTNLRIFSGLVTYLQKCGAKSGVEERKGKNKKRRWNVIMRNIN